QFQMADWELDGCCDVKSIRLETLKTGQSTWCKDHRLPSLLGFTDTSPTPLVPHFADRVSLASPDSNASTRRDVVRPELDEIVRAKKEVHWWRYPEQGAGLSYHNIATEQHRPAYPR